MEKKLTKLTKVLILIIIILLSYIAYAKYAEARDANLTQAAQFGYKQAIIDIAQLALTCQKIPLIMDNETIDIVAIDCLMIDGVEIEPLELVD